MRHELFAAAGADEDAKPDQYVRRLLLLAVETVVIEWLTPYRVKVGLQLFRLFNLTRSEQLGFLLWSSPTWQRLLAPAIRTTLSLTMHLGALGRNLSLDFPRSSASYLVLVLQSFLLITFRNLLWPNGLRPASHIQINDLVFIILANLYLDLLVIWGCCGCCQQRCRV